MIDYTLPEFVFLDGNSHEGDSLADRTVIQHTHTCTIMEVVALDEIKASSFHKPTFRFEYRDDSGVVERHMLVLHFSMIHDSNVPPSDALLTVFRMASDWYCDYLKWEDRDIDTSEKAKDN